LRQKNKKLSNRLPAKKAQNACRAVVGGDPARGHLRFFWREKNINIFFRPPRKKPHTR
jgi:hypothetical protein